MSRMASARLKKANLAWLGLALAVHGVLLLLPVGLWTPQLQVTPGMTVELIQWRSPPASPATIPREEAPGTKPRPAVPATDSSVPEQSEYEARTVTAPETTPDVESSSPDVVSSEPEVPLSVATLLHSAGRTPAGDSSQAPARNLGMHARHELPSNWGRGMGNEELMSRNPEMAVPMAPAEPVIVDRWLDANGNHNVVVTLPNGDTVCGRARAWDPMQPLVEHIMMFRTCGSGGKRTFEMASRPTPLWSTAD